MKARSEHNVILKFLCKRKLNEREKMVEKLFVYINQKL